jgi:hypothetical protein
LEYQQTLLLPEMFLEGGYTKIVSARTLHPRFALSEGTVKSAVAPELLSWNVSSATEYAAFAGDAIPERR